MLFRSISRDYTSQLKELARVVKLQQQARDKVAQLILQLKKTNTLRPKEDLPLLRSVERDQHEVTTRLSKAGSVESRTRELVEELKNNRLKQPKLQHRLERIIVELSTLRKFHLAKIETALTLTRKNADDDIFNTRQRRKQSSVPTPQQQRQQLQRSEERRVGKECRSRWSPYH
mgnify:CR=1 FL=1